MHRGLSVSPHLASWPHHRDAVGNGGWGGALYWRIRILVVIVEREGAVLGVSLGRCMVANAKWKVRWIVVWKWM